MYFLDKTRFLYLNRLEFIPVTENLIYTGYLLQRYDDYEDFTRKLAIFSVILDDLNNYPWRGLLYQNFKSKKV
jgi:hypothetical protein